MLKTLWEKIYIFELAIEYGINVKQIKHKTVEN